MARDPPPLQASSSTSGSNVSPNIRDLSVTPTAIVKARPTIIHPQLRDLILPLEKGRILYPRGPRVEELTWKQGDEGMDLDDEGAGEGQGRGKIIRESIRTLYSLMFIPNCLVVNKTLLAAGGQHGELFITNLPSSSSSSRSGSGSGSSSPSLSKRFSTKPLRPFSLTMNLQSRSINNSMILLPTYPTEWEKRSDERRIGNQWYSFRSRPGERDEDDEAEEEDTRAMEEAITEEEDEEAMDLDEDVDEDDEEPLSPSSPLTYPNNVPFQHAPRIRNPSTSPSTSSWATSGPSRRSVSFSDRRRVNDVRVPPPSARVARQSFSIPRPGTGMPPIEYVTSRSLPRRLDSMTFASTSTPSTRARAPRPPLASRRGESRMCGSKGHKHDALNDDPRILISNNDLRVEMFSLPVVQESSTPTSRTSSNPTFVSRRGQPPGRASITPRGPSHIEYGQRAQTQVLPHGAGSRPIPIPIPVPQFPIPRFGTRFGWDNPTPSSALLDEESLSEESSSEIWHRIGGSTVYRSPADIARQRLNRQREEFERTLGMRIAPHSSTMLGSRSGVGAGIESSRDSLTSGPGHPDVVLPADSEERKLVRIGGSKFKCAINHSSLSPDLKNMVSVGDSNEVYLFEVIGGGREFRKIGTYTAWSRDGRKFAAASQDGQVTVWDHRSSHPLAKFFTSQGPTHPASPSSPSFSSDLMSSMARGGGTSGSGGMPMLVDPVTGDTRSGASTSGREAARVVKFSPEGAPRDLLVFSEEHSNIHIIDAQTLDTHVVLPVPYTPTPLGGTSGARTGVEGAQWGIAGIAFDPTGQWLYSGTEGTVVEWDMRGGALGQGIWGMA